MKQFVISIMIVLSLTLTSNQLFAQGPPPEPPGDSGSGGGPIGGSSPLGSGTMMLLALGGLYLGYKSRKTFRDTDN